MKKSIVLLASVTVLFSTLTSSLVNVVQADQSVSKTAVNAQNVITNIPSSDFIKKFDKAVKLVNNQFVVIQKNMPVNATNEEIAQFNSLIAKNNCYLQRVITSSPSENIIHENNSIIIGQTLQDAKIATNKIKLNYKNGSTYLHVYWWGLRIGVSRSVLIPAVQIGCTIGSVYVPAKVLIATLGALGVGASYIPGGIVFNSSPQFTPIAGSGALVWGVGWQ